MSGGRRLAYKSESSMGTRTRETASTVRSDGAFFLHEHSYCPRELLGKKLFHEKGWTSYICSPAELSWRVGSRDSHTAFKEVVPPLMVYRV